MISSVNIPEYSRPGFGWTHNPREGESVRIIHSDIQIMDDFPSIAPSQFAYSFLYEQKQINDEFDKENYTCMLTRTLKTAMYSYFYEQLDSKHSAQFEELKTTKCSNNRSLQWDLMLIKPNVSFKLHAHPNIELIHVIQGTIHEYRRIGDPIKTKFEITDKFGPNLRDVQDNVFIHREVKAVPLLSSEMTEDKLSTSILINECGSIHLSFTRDDVSLNISYQMQYSLCIYVL